MYIELRACPSSHKWAFVGGISCCKYDTEGFISGIGEICDGSKISLNSGCCKDGAKVDCPNVGGCYNAGNENGV